MGCIQPKCDICGRFVRWDQAQVFRVRKYDMQHKSYVDDEVWGMCDDCASSQEIPLAVQ